MNVYIKKQSFFVKKVLIGTVLLFLFIAFLNISQEKIRNSFYYMTSPVQKVFWRAGGNTYGFFESFLTAKELKKENDTLKQENQYLLSQISSLQEIIQQAQAVKEVIQNTKTDDFKMVLGEVIGLDISHDYILINKGLDDGMLENMPVVSSQHVVYGKIFKVYKNFSTVMLISNKSSVLNVKIYPVKSASQGEAVSPEVGQSNEMKKNSPSQKPVYGAVKGNSNLSMYLDLVSSDSEMKEGNILVTSALEGIFPRDLLVGKIIAINKNDLKPFQTAEIEPFFDLKNIDNLFVIVDYMKK